MAPLCGRLEDLENMVHFYRPNNPRHGCGRWLGVTDLAHEKEACLFSHDALIHVSYTTMYIAYAAAAYQTLFVIQAQLCVHVKSGINCSDLPSLNSIDTRE